MDEFEMYIYFYLLYMMYLMVHQLNTQNPTERRWWVRPTNLTRDKGGYFVNNYLKMKAIDPEDFFKHTRMARGMYDTLHILEEDLRKQSIRTPIQAECRLALTLSYLSQGVSHQFLAWSYKMGKATVRKIILDTCKIIWKKLSPLYMRPPSVEEYKNIARQFWNQWNMPNCVGAINGKYINIRCPPNSGSLYYDHKGNFSIVLLAICDANHCFTYVDVDAYGSQSDGGVLAQSQFGQALLKKTLRIPSESNLPNSDQTFPFYFVGDAAFPLKDNIMRPYPGRLLNQRKEIFNYRLSRVRRVIENPFGILVARWRILLQNIYALPENATDITLACVVLHNYIKSNSLAQNPYCPPKYLDWVDNNGNIHEGEWRQEVAVPLQSVRLGSNNATRSAFQLRDLLAAYLMQKGAVPFQYNRN